MMMLRHAASCRCFALLLLLLFRYAAAFSPRLITLLPSFRHADCYVDYFAYVTLA